jgi:small subunit ribosomal protein S8
MHSDPIADLLTRIRNGSTAQLASVDIPHSTIKEAVVRILKSEGLISDFEITKETKRPNLRVHLRYDAKRRPVMREIKRVSRPGLRVYRGADEIKPVRSGLGTQIIATNRGMMTDREARKLRIGGEVICEVW